MKKKIHIILPNLGAGGAEKVMLLLARQFVANNFHVLFIVRRLTEKGFQEVIEREFEVINLNAKKVRHFPLALKNKYKTIQKPDLVIASLWPLTFLTALTLKFTNTTIKVICIEHGSLKYQTSKNGKLHQLFLKWSLKLTLVFCDKLVCVSQGLKDEINELTNYNKSKLISIPNPIKLDNSGANSDVINGLEKQLKGHVFLFVGRLKKVKNIPLLLKAFKKVTEKTDATLLILGDGSEFETLKKLSVTLGIECNVHFLGFINDCKPYYKIANTFVLSSDSEGFGNVIVEALAEGCTVVSTNCPYGPKEILDNGTYGYLAKVNNEEDLAKTMLKSITNPFPKVVSKERALYYKPSEIIKEYLHMIKFLS